MSDIVDRLRLLEEQFLQHDVTPGMMDAVEGARAEIERLRAALRAIAACDERDDMDVAMQIAREALGDE